MRRRDFIKVIGGAAATWPLAANAQNAGKLPTIGLMASGTVSTHGKFTATFVQRLRELGWIEDRNIRIEYRWGEGRDQRFAEIAAEFVRLKVDVIVINSTPAVLAAKQATSNIPIVFPTAADPVGTGLVASLARPGGNITGVGFQNTDTTSKRVQLLREVLPDLRRLAILGNSDDPAEMREAQTVATALSLEINVVGIQRAEEISRAFEAFKGQADALYVATHPLFIVHAGVLGTLALDARLPTVYSLRPYAGAGGLMSYGANLLDLWRRAAEMVDKVLRGAKPADIPVEQPTKFELVINLKTAKALGLKISESFLQRADEVIE